LFDVEARKPQKEESVEILPKFPTFNYQPQEEVEEEESYNPTWSFQEARSEVSQPEEAPLEAVVEEVPAPTPTPAPTVQFEEEVIPEEESPEEPPAKNIKKKKAAKKKSMTLTEFFARKDESAEHAKVKVCIVQKGDTVNTVADRYDVTVQNLLRVNNLELSQDIFEGQVLYIPGTLAKK
jgi:stage VI sporulation protein D